MSNKKLQEEMKQKKNAKNVLKRYKNQPIYEYRWKEGRKQWVKTTSTNK